MSNNAGIQMGLWQSSGRWFAVYPNGMRTPYWGFTTKEAAEEHGQEMAKKYEETNRDRN